MAFSEHADYGNRDPNPSVCGHAPWGGLGARLAAETANPSVCGNAPGGFPGAKVAAETPLSLWWLRPQHLSTAGVECKDNSNYDPSAPPPLVLQVCATGSTQHSNSILLTIAGVGCTRTRPHAWLPGQALARAAPLLASLRGCCEPGLGHPVCVCVRVRMCR
eukprot:1159612-Pelagomonas_calceolata.AAC.8